MDPLMLISRHRWSALMNGVVIGLGVGYLLVLFHPLGLLPLVLGVGLEMYQRRRMRQ